MRRLALAALVMFVPTLSLAAPSPAVMPPAQQTPIPTTLKAVKIEPRVTVPAQEKTQLQAAFKKAAKAYLVDKDAKTFFAVGATFTTIEARDTYDAWAYALATHKAQRTTKSNLKAEKVAPSTIAPWTYVFNSGVVNYYLKQGCHVEVAIDMTIRNIGAAYPPSEPAPEVWTWGHPLNPYLSNTYFIPAPKLATNQTAVLSSGVLKAELTTGVTDPQCIGQGNVPVRKSTIGWIDLDVVDKAAGRHRVSWEPPPNSIITVTAYEPPPEDNDLW